MARLSPGKEINIMNMIAVSSSSIAFIGYDAEHMTLRIQFREGGVYDYHGVPEMVYQQFISAPSKGRYYARFIKGRFNQQRIL